MALDVAEFLWNKFLKSLAELESESNSGSITISVFKSSIKDLVSEFKAIKDVVNERDIMPKPYTRSEIIDVLYNLNDALAECRVFAHECIEITDMYSRFNFRRFTFISKIKGRLATIKQELEDLPQPQNGNPREKTEFTGSGPKLSAKVFGFDEQLKEINEKLLQAGGSSSSSAGKLTAIGVVGIAGVGKTTLVQKVLESEEVMKKFNHILWLPFSGMSEGEQQYSRFSFETRIFDGNGRTIEERVVGLDKLLERLSRLLLSRKCYLIVLDDVCHRHINIMERLCSGLPKHIGSAIIVTTRLKEVALKLGKQHELTMVHVKPLDGKICGSIFLEHLLSRDEVKTTIRENVSGEEIEEHLLSKMEEVVSREKFEEIKNRCHGLPLVAKTIANTIAVERVTIPVEAGSLDLFQLVLTYPFSL